MKKLSLLVVLALAASASAAVVEDFEGEWTGAGVIVPDPTNPANNALHLAGGQAVAFATSAGEGIMTVDVYDMGATAHDEGEANTQHSGYGPRWGVSGGGKSVAASLVNKNFLNSRNGYGYGLEGRTGSWFSPMYFGGPRRVESLQVIGDGTWDDPDVPGVGAWHTWTFYIASSGLVTLTDGNTIRQVSGEIPAGGLQEIWLSGGRSGMVLNGTMLFDNVTFVIPEPATLGLLAVGALAMLRRRRA